MIKYFFHCPEENRPWYITLFLSTCLGYTLYNHFNTYDFNGLILYTYISTYFLCGIFYLTDVYYEKNNLLQEKRFSKIKKIDCDKFIKGTINCAYNSTLINTSSRMLIFYPILKYRGYDNWNIKDYSYYEIFCSMFFTLVIADIYFYTMHRLFHKSRFLYNNIHYLHHTFVDTYASIFNSGHMLESLILNEGFIMIPLIFTNLPKELIFIWILLATLSSIITHSDYDILGVSHVIHHKKYNKNFGFDFINLDYLFNTNN